MIKLISKQSEASTSYFTLKTQLHTPNANKHPVTPIYLKHNSKKKRFSSSQNDRVSDQKFKALKLTFINSANKSEQNKHLDNLSSMLEGKKNVKRIQFDVSHQETKMINQMEQTRSIFTVGSSYICPGQDFIEDSPRLADKREIIKLKHHRKRAVSPIDKLFFNENNDTQYTPLQGKS